MAKFTSNKKQVLAQMESNIAAWAVATGEEYTAAVKTDPNMRVDTGRMRDAQGYETSSDNRQITAGNATEYGVHVHFPGITRNWAGSPFMTSALNNFGNRAQEIANATLTQGFDN